MKLSKEEGKSIVWEDHEDWETIEVNIVDTTRWSIINEGVYKHIPTGKFYSIGWSEGATECQDEGPFDYCEPEPIEVKPVELEAAIKILKAALSIYETDLDWETKYDMIFGMRSRIEPLLEKLGTQIIWNNYGSSYEEDTKQYCTGIYCKVIELEKIMEKL